LFTYLVRWIYFHLSYQRLFKN